jgi:long-chain acyl-CoA synthetase
LIQTIDPTNFGEISWRARELFPTKLAVEQDDLSLTYGQLDVRIQRVAGMLHERGVRRGDRVLLMFPNDYRFIESLFGTLRIGAVAVPANIRLGTETLCYIGDHSEAVMLIGHERLADKVEAVAASASALKNVLTVGESYEGGEYEELLGSAPTDLLVADVAGGDVALQMYTSGSTGAPKGCLLSHTNKWWQARSSARSMLFDESDKALIAGPLYHANALWACLLPMLYVGGSVAILDEFDPVAVIKAIERYRPTFTSGTPSMFGLLLAHRELLENHDTSSIELLLCGSAPVPEELMTELIETFGCEVVESYGLTEGGANVMTPRWGVKKIGSTGLPVPDVEIRVVDPEEPSRDLDVGEIGELWSRCPANAVGYFKQPEVTKQKFTDDGWLRTGDLVRLDRQGYVYFCGRTDDMINCGGENVYPKEVENILLTHPGVADVCVVAAKHAVKGEAPVAWVVPDPTAEPTEQQLKQYFLEHGPAYAHPRRVFFLDRLPLSGTNKIDRNLLGAKVKGRIPEGLGSSAG